MSLKIHPIVVSAAIVGVVILVFALFRGCNKSKKEEEAKAKALVLADSALVALKEYKTQSEKATKAFADTLEFERGQYALLNAQKERTEVDLSKMDKQVKGLIAKHKLAEYTDTAATLVPGEYITDCEGCFTKLEGQNNLVNRYINDINKLQDNWDKQNIIYQARFKELDAEKLGFYNKINSLAKQAQDAASQLKPHGRLYLSWGVIWGPLPEMAGAGLLYQNKRNLLWGAKWYYGSQGHMVETTINFPLSLKFR